MQDDLQILLENQSQTLQTVNDYVENTMNYISSGNTQLSDPLKSSHRIRKVSLNILFF